MFIPGINYYVPNKAKKSRDDILKEYLLKLEACLELGIHKSEIKRNMQFYNDRILNILELGEILPDSISKHFKLLPQEIVLNLKEVEWVLDSAEKLQLLGEFVRAVDVEKMKLWHIKSEKSVEEMLGLENVSCGAWSTRIISHESFLNQFTSPDDFLYRNGVLSDRKGRDGFI
jgi:hypothetical protein